MEKKQLNFNAPLISVRRMSSIVSQPEEVIRKTIGKAPPNRQQSLPVLKCKRDVGEVTKPAAVPFVWEQTPGRRKPENERKAYAYEEPSSTTPKLPPGRMRDSIRFYSGERPRSQNIYNAHPWNDHAALLDSLVESMYTKGESDGESRDEAYSDATDTLSPSESLSLNCSISGLSGYQGLDVKPSGAFAVDVQTRDFMMSRFLPAAKAVVLETPQYVPKKELVVVAEQPKPPVKKVIPVENKPLPIQKYDPHVISHYSKYTENIASESEDEMDENVPEKQHKRSGISWKLFPRLCVKNSLCLLSPLPGMKSRTRAPSPAPTPPPPAKDIKRLTRNAYSGPLNMPRKAYSGPLDKQVCEAMYNKRFHPLSGELYKVADNKRAPNQLPGYDGLSPHRNSRSGAISPYRNVAPRSPFNEGARFLGVPREVEKASGYVRDTPRKSTGKIASDEKTVYVDSVNNVEIPSQDLASSKPKSVVTGSNENLKNLIRNIRVVDVRRKFNPESLELAEKVLASTTCVSKLRGGLTEKKDASKLNSDSNQELGSLELAIVCTNGNIASGNEDNSKPDDESNSSQSPLPPPLPKSPSESWLWRTLPSVPLQNPQKPRPNATKTATKWETIVKSSNLHHDHTRYSEELVPHSSRQQKRV
ncbi:PREDICTED: uncharacterized protein LOC109162477 [Ipomoea nil]|uniref:uncharacterized protein LOC109162477 n=1 Tax=Ipomoea nil TaxID=35883 RepID=UPI000900B95A|nr:PREDICTED: uncharacterized protein LOC109162477 [Ipomoea nil]XP_019166723.1 PREDICTED: uncharacterized protein LOC109162477 [Ipomoea nil]XP_019166724.1 PREDICTED: uncharacterized protein LOC109162477 [Ipomoea nil]